MNHQIQTQHPLTERGSFETTSSTMTKFITTNDITTMPAFRKYINDEDFLYIIFSLLTILSGVVSMLGVICNVINIIVFIRQGAFTDSSTVTLLGLAVADLVSTSTMLWMGITFGLAVMEPPGLNWDPFHIMYMTGAFPHMVSGLITRAITAIVAFERCFCVIFPFNVKSVFTPRFSLVLVVFTFLYYIGSYVPLYVYNTFHWWTNPETNETRLILVEHPEWQPIQMILGYINLYLLNFLSVGVVLICTVITVSRVKLSSQWRESVTTTSATGTSSSNHGNEIDKSKKEESGFTNKAGGQSQSQQVKKTPSSKMQKEKKLIRMISMISILFLICYVPNIALPITLVYDYNIRTNGPASNLAWVLHGIVFFSETVNSSLNIFIYYRMSSRFHKEFNALFGIRDDK